MKYSLEQWVFVYDNFVKYESGEQLWQTWVQPFPDSPEPSKAMIHNLIKKFCTTRSVLDKKRTYEKRDLTEEMLDQ